MKNKTKILFLLILLIPIIIPNNVEAETIKQFEDKVAKYTAELQEKKNKIAKNDQEVNQIKAKISEIEKQISQSEIEIKNLENEIEKSNQQIAEKEEESKKIMKYFQVVNGENSYLEYVFGATSITDMVYRLSVVEQLTKYNQKVITELNDLINENNRKKASLIQKKSDLDKLEKELESEKEKINADTRAIKETMPSLEDQIKSAKEQIAYLKKIGCSANEEKTACLRRYFTRSSGSSSGGGGSIPSTNGFFRPMEYGYLTQGYGGYGGHMGVDLSSSNKSITLYPIASGQVSAKYYDSAGALVLKIRHIANGQIIYSTYAHLRSWYVNVGQNVTPDTAIGQMGSTGNSTGPHLHLEITTCDWKSAGGGCTWSEYMRSTVSPFRYVQIPSSWSNR